MPLRLDDIERYGAPISFLGAGEVDVRVGPCSTSSLKSKKIPLDGRHYICSGNIILKNGMELQVNFEINTHTFDFLERDSVKIYSFAKRKDARVIQLFGQNTSQVSCAGLAGSLSRP